MADDFALLVIYIPRISIIFTPLLPALRITTLCARYETIRIVIRNKLFRREKHYLS